MFSRHCCDPYEHKELSLTVRAISCNFKSRLRILKDISTNKTYDLEGRPYLWAFQAAAVQNNRFDDVVFEYKLPQQIYGDETDCELHFFTFNILLKALLVEQNKANVSLQNLLSAHLAFFGPYLRQTVYPKIAFFRHLLSYSLPISLDVVPLTKEGVDFKESYNMVRTRYLSYTEAKAFTDIKESDSAMIDSKDPAYQPKISQTFSFAEHTQRIRTRFTRSSGTPMETDRDFLDRLAKDGNTSSYYRWTMVADQAPASAKPASFYWFKQAFYEYDITDPLWKLPYFADTLREYSEYKFLDLYVRMKSAAKNDHFLVKLMQLNSPSYTDYIQNGSTLRAYWKQLASVCLDFNCPQSGLLFTRWAERLVIEYSSQIPETKECITVSPDHPVIKGLNGTIFPYCSDPTGKSQGIVVSNTHLSIRTQEDHSNHHQLSTCNLIVKTEPYNWNAARGIFFHQYLDRHFKSNGYVPEFVSAYKCGNSFQTLMTRFVGDVESEIINRKKGVLHHTVVEAMFFLAQQLTEAGVVHGDLKPDQFLFAMQRNAKTVQPVVHLAVTDFGFSGWIHPVSSQNAFAKSFPYEPILGWTETLYENDNGTRQRVTTGMRLGQVDRHHNLYMYSRWINVWQLHNSLATKDLKIECSDGKVRPYGFPQESILPTMVNWEMCREFSRLEHLCAARDAGAMTSKTHYIVADNTMRSNTFPYSVDYGNMYFDHQVRGVNTAIIPNMDTTLGLKYNNFEKGWELLEQDTSTITRGIAFEQIREHKNAEFIKPSFYNLKLLGSATSEPNPTPKPEPNPTPKPEPEPRPKAKADHKPPNPEPEHRPKAKADHKTPNPEPDPEPHPKPKPEADHKTRTDNIESTKLDAPVLGPAKKTIDRSFSKVTGALCPQPGTLRLQEKNCAFEIYRGADTQNCDHAYVVSVWAGTDHYGKVMKLSIPFWTDIFPKIPKRLKWKVRMYVDSLSWNFLKDAFPNVNNLPVHLELYLFTYKPAIANDKAGNHTKTFGSVVRFHALTDPTLKSAMIRNLEQFTSPEDIYEVEKLEEQDMENKSALPALPRIHYFVFYTADHGKPIKCHLETYDICASDIPDIYGAGTLSFFRRSLNEPIPWTFSDFLCEADRANDQYPYGVDEVVFFTICKRIEKKIKLLPRGHAKGLSTRLSLKECMDVIENMPGHKRMKQEAEKEISKSWSLLRNTTGVRWIVPSTNLVVVDPFHEKQARYRSIQFGPILRELTRGGVHCFAENDFFDPLFLNAFELMDEECVQRIEKNREQKNATFLFVDERDFLSRIEPSQMQKLSRLSDGPPVYVYLWDRVATNEQDPTVKEFNTYVRDINRFFIPCMNISPDRVKTLFYPAQWYFCDDLVKEYRTELYPPYSFRWYTGFGDGFIPETWLSTYCFDKMATDMFSASISRTSNRYLSYAEFLLSLKWKSKIGELRLHQVLREETWKATLQSPWQYESEKREKMSLMKAFDRKTPWDQKSTLPKRVDADSSAHPDFSLSGEPTANLGNKASDQLPVFTEKGRTRQWRRQIVQPTMVTRSQGKFTMVTRSKKRKLIRTGPDEDDGEPPRKNASILSKMLL